MSQLAMFAVDWLAVGLLALALYFPRHRRRDLVVSFLCANIGVLAVSSVLSSAAIAAGVGLGLFGVLSIIRLRSTELEQHEVAYYFSALALGLLAGLATPSAISVGLMAMILVVIFVGDHPRLFPALPPPPCRPGPGIPGRRRADRPPGTTSRRAGAPGRRPAP